jgi:hypothetical protein
VALRRDQLDLDHCQVRIDSSTAETDAGHLIDDDPKSLAGIRIVAFPEDIALELAAAQRATLRELIERMGHSSTRAALIYLHATRERDQRIAAGMGQLFKDATAARQAGTKYRTSGTQRARGKERDS